MHIDLIKWKDRLILLIFPLLIWVSRYIYTPLYGLYEDDYSRIPPPMEMDLIELGAELSTFFTQHVGQGRPFQLTFTFIQAYLGSRIGGLEGIYLIGFGTLTLNAIMFYFLLRRLTNNTFAITGAVLFCIYSADTNQAYLTHSLGVYPSITFLLLSIHAYLSNRKILSYLFALAILITYETPYPLLLAMPLLELDREWDKKFFKSVTINGFIVTAMLLAVFLIRYLLGEGRIASLSIPEASGAALRSMIIGPVVNIGLFFYRPIQALQQLDAAIVIVTISSLITLFFLFIKLDFSNAINDIQKKKTSEAANHKLELSLKGIAIELHELLTAHYKLLISGLAMLILSYPLTLTVRPYAISGRDTRVHFAGLIGFSIFWATIFFILNFLSSKHNLSKLGAGVTSTFFALTIGFGMVVQQDYARAWELQRIFWRSLTDTIAYTEESVTILVDPQGLEDTQYIDANTWSLPWVYQYIYSFPDDQTQGPQIFRLIPNWREQLQVNSTEIKALNFRYQLVTSRWENTIILETYNNRISDRLRSIVVAGKEYSLNQEVFDRSLEPIPGVLYPEIFE